MPLNISDGAEYVLERLGEFIASECDDSARKAVEDFIKKVERRAEWSGYTLDKAFHEVASEVRAKAVQV